MGNPPAGLEQSALVTQNIYRLMDERGLNRLGLAKASGIDDSSLYRKLDRKPHTFTVEDLMGISDALGVNLPDLFATA